MTYNLLLMTVLALTGCGYTTRSMVATQYKTIHVAPFVNKIDFTREVETNSSSHIYQPGMEADITRAVVDRLLFDGNLRPVKVENADLSLKGELVEFRRDPLRYTEGDDVLEYRLNIVVNLSLWDVKENTLKWEENSFTGETTYFTSGNLAKPESLAINDALNDLARRVVERIVEQW